LLLELRVKDLGIIEDINWKLDVGLNIITGETGAGKSQVLDAVELLLNGTASDDLIRYGASEARIEGVFALSQDPRYTSLHMFLSEKDLTSVEDTLVIKCEIKKQKPSLVRINGNTVTKTILRQVGQLLVDIHGQSEHLSLLDKKYHLDFLDGYGRTSALKNNFSNNVAQLRLIESELAILENKEKENTRQEEFLKYQINEIKIAMLREAEDEEMENERRIISHSEKLKEYSNSVHQAISESASAHYAASALNKLNEAVQAMKKLVELDPSLVQQLDYLEKSVYGLEEVAREILAYSDKLEHDPRRLEEIESRLELIRNLKRKYGKTIAEILMFQRNSEQELAGFGISSERKTQLKKQRDQLRNDLGQLARDLTLRRSQAAQQLKTDITKELQELEMSQVRFEVSITQTRSAEGILGVDNNLYAFNSGGIDNVEFLVSTNPGEPLKPLAKIASTGEISRFTLALKGALSEADSIPVLIFDEIDIGIGGRSGDIIGEKLWALSKNHQVICVTHLPQIAAYADSHFYVHKEVSGNRTTSTLEVLKEQSRIRELAIMLGGSGYTETALRNAEELFQKAGSWKKTNSIE
jgi:DNA repair protein RecN (Recombination protein N)